MSDSYSHAMLHPADATALQAMRIPFGRADAPCTPEKVAIAARLIPAFKAGRARSRPAAAAGNTPDLWTGIVAGNFAQMHDCIERGDAAQLAQWLSGFGGDYTWFGGLTTGVDGYSHWHAGDEKAVAYSYFDKLLCLAEAVGVLPAEDPEQGSAGNWGHNIRLQAQAVADAVADHFRIDIVPPGGIIPVAGLALEEGLLHYRHLNGLYVAGRIRDLTRPADRICEYGGGLGFVAYYLRLLGRRDVTLFDLPVTNLLSGFFLIGALGHDAVCLEGEPQRPGAIKIRSGWACVDMPARHFSLCANVDSFPEISVDIVRFYLKQIERHTSGYFFHVNQEVEQAVTNVVEHERVPRLVAQETGMRRLYRAPYWLRRGYVEELYRIRGSRLRERWGRLF